MNDHDPASLVGEPGRGVSPTDRLRLRLDLAYDGTAFSGWAAQPGRRTVQDTAALGLQRALRLAEPVSLTCAGRTDAGVHARGQVAHADVPGGAWHEHGAAALRRLGGALPADIRVSAIAPAPPGFDARFSALWRRYVYRIVDAPAQVDPLLRGWVLSHPYPLEPDLMTRAASSLLGEHDFAAYCRRREGASTIRTLQRLDCHRVGVVIEATVVADAFCHSMVRSLMGALVAVGAGRRPPDWPGAVLAADRRDSSVPVLPAHGLVLEEVAYPDEAHLAERQRLTRQRRVLHP